MDTDIVRSDDHDTEFGGVDETMRQFCEHIGDYPYPMEMAGKGAVIGAAFGMSIECDFVVLVEETTFPSPSSPTMSIRTSGGLRTSATSSARVWPRNSS